MAEYQKDHYLRRLTLAKNLLGGKCIDCGSIENLEFDHIDPATKSFVITSGYKKRLEVFIAEVHKCQLLCHECHVRKTSKDRRKSAQHGHYHWAVREKYPCVDCGVFRKKRSAVEKARKANSNTIRTPGE